LPIYGVCDSKFKDEKGRVIYSQPDNDELFPDFKAMGFT